ncbi:MAG: FAD-dependent oxidoreductase, partial [Bacteroidales bacterium]
MKKHPKIVVVGAGAMGSTTAVMLARNQFDVTLVCKY